MVFVCIVGFCCLCCDNVIFVIVVFRISIVLFVCIGLNYLFRISVLSIVVVSGLSSERNVMFVLSMLMLCIYS